MMIRPVDEYISFPFVSNNAVVNTDIPEKTSNTRIEFICQGSQGHGLVQWRLPAEIFGLESSTAGPRQMLLTVSGEIEIPDLAIEFECFSEESGANTSFYYAPSELHVISGVTFCCSVTHFPLLSIQRQIL